MYAIGTCLDASTVSAAALSGTVVSDTCSPSVVGFVFSVSSSKDSEFSSIDSSSLVSVSLAATELTRALSIAGSETKDTSSSEPLATTRTPSTKSCAFTLTPTLKPSRKPVAASTSASLPAVVSAILNVASIPCSVAVIDKTFPIGRVRSCSSNNLTFLVAIDSGLNVVSPADVDPVSFHVTTRPVIVRVSLSADVIVSGMFSFI